MTILEMLEAHSFKKNCNYYCGKINDFFTSAVEISNAKADYVRVTFPCKINKPKGRLVDLLDNYKKNKIIENYSYTDTSFFIDFSANCTGELAKDVLLETTTFLKELETNSICEICQNPEELFFYGTNKGPFILCPDCAEKTKNDLLAHKNRNTNYIKGFFGSLIGAIIGSAVWIILGLAGFYASIAGFAIAYAAFWGYNFMKGKGTKVGVVINIITILIASFFAQYIDIFLDLTRAYPEITFPVYVYNTPELFTDLAFLKSLLPSFLLGLLFAFLGSNKIIRTTLAVANQMGQAHIEKIEIESTNELKSQKLIDNN